MRMINTGRVPNLPFSLTDGVRVKTAPGMADLKRWSGGDWQLTRYQPGEKLMVFAAVRAEVRRTGLRVTARVQIATPDGYEWTEKSILCKSLDVQVPDWAVTTTQANKSVVVSMSVEDYDRIASLIAEARECVEQGRHIDLY